MPIDTARPPSPQVARRRREMLNALTEAGSAQLDALAQRFGVSRNTVHRDLDELAEQGLVRKVHGGATIRASALIECNIALRQTLLADEKQAMARLAAEMIEPGQAIMIDDSTTAQALLPLLPGLAPLTVITNSLGLAQGLCRIHGIKVICLGGTYVPTYDAFFGLVCEQAIGGLFASTLFMSASAVIGGDAYHQDEEVVKTKRAMMGVVDQRVLMVGSNKFGMTALNRLAGLKAFDLVLTDDGLDDAQRHHMQDAGIDLRIAERQTKR